MDALSLLRTLGSLGLILGMLAGGLWAVRRFGLRLPGPTSRGHRLELVDRAVIDGRRTAVLLRRDGREHLLLLAPEGTTVVESAIVRDALDQHAAETRAAEREAQRLAAEEAVRRTHMRLAETLSQVHSTGRWTSRRVRIAVRRTWRLMRVQGPALLGSKITRLRAGSFAAVLARQQDWRRSG